MNRSNAARPILCALLAITVAGLLARALLHRRAARVAADPPGEPVRLVRPTRESGVVRAQRVAEHLGPALGAALEGRLAAPPLEAQPGGRWSLHCCLLDRQCRSFGAGARLHVSVPAGHLALSLEGGAGAAWRWAERRACRNVVVLGYREAQLAFYRQCPRRRAHRGACQIPGSRAPRARPVVVHHGPPGP